MAVLFLSFIAGWLYGWFLFVFVRERLHEQNNKHWSKQDWWVNRHEHRFDDLQEEDRPHLFD